VDISEAIASAVDSALPPTTPDVDDTEAPVTDAPEVEAAPDIDPTTDADEAVTSSDDETADEAAVELPEGYVAVPVVKDALATEFTLKDAEGEVEIPDLVVEYKANGKVRQDRLDQVVKLAQWGVYNAEREQQIKQVEQQAQLTQQELEQYATVLQEREAQIERLLTDEDFLYAVREAYEVENSPEKRAERAMRETENLRVQYQMADIERSGAQFYESEVSPAIDMIVTALPTIAPDELLERFTYAMQAHVEVAPNGQPYIPASRYDAVRKYIVDDLASWAQFQHSRRAQPVAPSPVQAKESKELERARVDAQKAKRVVGQATKPIGRSGGTSTEKPRASRIASVDDAVSSALDEVLSSIR
jgi:hypothetical protein